MVFGLFEKGKMTIELNKLNFSLGEIIEGTAKMQLKKPTKAKGVFVVLFEEINTQKVGGYNNRDVGMSNSVQRGFEFVQPLDVEKEYGTQEYEYKFKINIPQNNTNQKNGSAIDGVLNTVKLFTIGNQHSKWFVEVKLDVPKGFDLRKKTQINLS